MFSRFPMTGWKSWVFMALLSLMLGASLLQIVHDDAYDRFFVGLVIAFGPIWVSWLWWRWIERSVRRSLSGDEYRGWKPKRPWQ